MKLKSCRRFDDCKRWDPDGTGLLFFFLVMVLATCLLFVFSITCTQPNSVSAAVGNIKERDWSGWRRSPPGQFCLCRRRQSSSEDHLCGRKKKTDLIVRYRKLLKLNYDVLRLPLRVRLRSSLPLARNSLMQTPRKSFSDAISSSLLFKQGVSVFPLTHAPIPFSTGSTAAIFQTSFIVLAFNVAAPLRAA